MSRSILNKKIKKAYLGYSGAQRGPAEESTPHTKKIGTTAQLVVYYEKWKELKYSGRAGGMPAFFEVLLQFITDHIIVYPSVSLRDYCLREDVEEGLRAARLSRFRPYTFQHLQRHVNTILRQQPESLDLDKGSIRKSLRHVYAECESVMMQPPSVLLSRAPNLASSELLLSCYDTAESTRDTAILALAMVVHWDIETLEKTKGGNFRTTDGKQWFFDNFVSNKAKWVALPSINTAAILMHTLTQDDERKELFNGYSSDGPFALTGSEISEIIARRLALHILQEKSKRLEHEKTAEYAEATTQWMLNEQIPFYSASIMRKRQAVLATKIRGRRHHSLLTMQNARELDFEQTLTQADPIWQSPTAPDSIDAELQYWVELLNKKPSDTVTKVGLPLRDLAIESNQKIKKSDDAPSLFPIPVASTSAPGAGQLKTPEDGYFPEDWDSAVVRAALFYNDTHLKEDEDEPSDEEWSTAILNILDSDDLNEM